MTSDISIKFPKAPGLTLEQAKETHQKVQELKADLDSDGVAIYSNWTSKIKSNWPGKNNHVK